MTIEVDCFICAKTYRVADTLAGKRIKCKSCGELLDVARPRTADDEEDYEPEPAPRAPARKKTGSKGRGKRSSNGPSMGVLVGGGGAALVVLIALGMVLTSGRRPAAPGGPPGADASVTGGAAGAPVSDLSKPSEWSLQTDLPKTLLAGGPPAKLEIAFSDRFEYEEQLGFSSLLSPYAVVAREKHPNVDFEVWNLVSGNRSARFTGTGSDLHNLVVSPDGRYVAFAPSFGTDWHLYEAASGKLLQTVKCSEDRARPFHVKMMGFPSSDRLVAVGQVGNGIRVWGIPDGKLLASVDAGTMFLGSSSVLAFSPGGAYFATVADFLKHSVGVYDASTGKRLGLFPGPKDCEFDSCGFAADGSALTLLYRVRTYGENALNASRFITVRLDGGEVVADFNISPSLEDQLETETGRRSIAPFPSGGLWLAHERAVIDPAKKSVVHLYSAVKRAESPIIRKPLGKDWVVGIEPGVDGARMIVEPLDTKSLSSGAATLAEGGLATDIGLPPLVKADYRDATTLVVKADWTHKPATPGESAKPAATIPLEETQGQPDELVIGGNRAVVRHVVGAAKASRVDEMIKAMNATSEFRRGLDESDNPSSSASVSVYDVQSGKRLSNWSPAKPSALHGVTGDGQLAILRSQKGQGRLDLFRTEDGQHAAAWRPYAGESDKNDQLWAVEPVGAKMVATVNTAGRLVVWETSPPRAKYQLEDVWAVAATPDGASLVVARHPTIKTPYLAMFDLATGSSQGMIDGVPCRHLACQPDGRHVAVTTNDSGGTRLELVDLTTGRSVGRWMLPGLEESVAWCGPNQLLINRTAVFDVSLKAVVWSYDTAQTPVAPSGVAGEAWWVATAEGPATIRHAPLPDAATREKLVPAELAKSALLKPGDPVVVRIAIGGEPELADLSRRAQKDLELAVGRSGYKVRNEAPASVKFTASIVAKGTAEFSQLGAVFGGKESVTIKEAVVTIELESGGRVIWQTRQAAQNADGFALVRKEQGESAQQAIDRGLREKIAKFGTDFSLPAYVLGGEGKGMGSSSLSTVIE
jgi:hypothetical protein